MKRTIFILLIIICVTVTIGCETKARTPLTVTFNDISSALSTDHTIKISFSEEKDYENCYIDILVKSDKDVNLTLFQEFSQENNKINLNVGKDFISLDEYKIFNLKKEQTDSMVGYKDALQTILVVNSNQDATLTFLAVIGEKDNDNFKQIAFASKEYLLQVKQKNKEN